MEIRARYTLIGMFTLAVTAAAFGFVYWLNTTGGLYRRSTYQVRFESSVSGLQTGSAVLFNGVRVGEVTGLDLSVSDPRQVTVSIAVDSSTPVRADTKVGIEFQGLMGAPAISLSGGTSQSPLGSGAEGETAALVADPAAGKNITEAAREVLGHIDAVVSDNAEPMRTMIANLSKFSEALGRNSEHVDGIVAGLERLTGGAGRTPPAVYELTAPRSFPSFDKPPSGQLVVREPTALEALATDKILVRGERGIVSISDDARWGDLLPLVFQSRVLQSFENAGLLREASRPVDGLNADFQLMTEFRKFELVAGPQPSAEIEFSAKLLSADGKILAARTFQATAPAKAMDAAAAAEALDAAFGKLAIELVVWTSTAMRGGA